ncbi:MAG: type II secretion system F family protein [Rhodobacteraceae bacterium]|nr:type II secretion system F family protein [Paracoccaceae bacterium]
MSKGSVVASVLRLERILTRVQFGRQRRVGLYRELIALMRAGFSRSEAIDMIWTVKSEDGKNRRGVLPVVIADIRLRIRNGLGFSEALRNWVPSEDCMVIGTIEHSDQFADHLEVYCETVERKSGLIAEMISALTYPGLLVATAYGMLTYFSAGIVPTLDRILPVERWSGLATIVYEAGRVAAGSIPVVVSLLLLCPVMIVLLLPRWARRGRTAVDRMPVFALYRVHTGILFLQAMACLMASGMSAMEAIRKIRPSTNNYVGYRLDLIRYHLLNGLDLGSAMEKAGTGWPDRELNLTLRILARTPDFPQHLLVCAKRWMEERHKVVERQLALIRAASFGAVFGVIFCVVLTMYDIQSQVTAGY